LGMKGKKKAKEREKDEKAGLKSAKKAGSLVRFDFPPDATAEEIAEALKQLVRKKF